MKGWSLVILLLFALLPPLKAQQMSVEEFVRLRNTIFKPRAVSLDKSVALMDLVTDETGFTCTANGGEPVDVSQGEGVITLSLPHKTRFFTLCHPQFGQLVWKVPDRKTLKKNRHYRALLFASDPSKDIKATKQWVVFRLSPGDVLLRVDSLTKAVRRDVVEYCLPVGTHTYRVEAPFYEPEEGNFILSDEERTDITVRLQPFYSYLTVKSSWQGGDLSRGDLYIDNAQIRAEEATSYRLRDGYHYVSFYVSDKCLYDSLVYVGRGQKKILELKDKDMYIRSLKRSSPRMASPGQPELDEQGLVMVPLKVSAPDSLAEIWVDRERLATGEWEGRLSAGFHIAQAVKDGQESVPSRFWLEEGIPQEVTLQVPGSGFGLLNIHCNVDGASILIDGKHYGETPLIIKVDASRSCEVTLQKDGYKELKRRIHPRGNHQVDVNMTLKKK